MNLTNKVSIIVPCYEQGQYLDECLESVFTQTHQNWECLIVNDGSSDNTEEVAEKWINNDDRFKYLYKENGGLSSARNYGIAYAKGELILPLDADDKISSNYIALAVRSFQENMTLKIVYCKAEKFGESSGIWHLEPFSLLNLCIFNMIFCSAMFKKQDWELVGGYDEKMIYGLEDWEFWIAILKNGGDVKCLDEIGFYYRIKSSSMIKLMNGEKIKYSREYMSVKHADFFVRHLGSFAYLKDSIRTAKKENDAKLKSKKFIVDVFFTVFFGFSIFGSYKK